MKTHRGGNQFIINYICSCLLFCSISTTKDLIEHFDHFIDQLKQNPELFKGLSPKQIYHLLKIAIDTYNDVNALKIRFNRDLIKSWHVEKKESSPYLLRQVPTTDDLSRITQSYDRLVQAHALKKEVQQSIPQVLNRTGIIVVPHIIIGAGDTGTTVWLEKYKKYHGTTKEFLSEDKLPPVLIVSDNTGSWKHNYTLAQPQNILERPSGRENPSAYLPIKAYLSNPYANGRHVFQANQVNLAKTQAPLVHATVLKIEKKENHLITWEAPEQEYRLVVELSGKITKLYTDELNICTGLGPARNAIAGSLITHEQFKQLNTRDPHKKFTPVVDGNQFILTGMEEKGAKSRTIVIYGGGGTAAACYRKGFFGHDVHTEGRAFTPENQSNTVIWIAKQFDKAGTGKLATTALKTAKERNELLQGELIGLTPQKNGKLLLVFNKINTTPAETFEFECDQLVYSIGQDDRAMQLVCAEISAELNLVFDEHDMILNVSSPDGKVLFFGAAAMAIREKEYAKATWQWLHQENIGGDVGPGSMPPSRAQIKRYNFLKGIQPESINANMDSQHLILSYLKNLGINAYSAKLFVDDLLEARKLSSAGCKREVIQELLNKQGMDVSIEIQGHGHLIAKKAPSQTIEQQTPMYPLLSWLKKDKKKTNDANILLSTVEASKIEDDLKDSGQYLSNATKICS